MSEAIGMMDGAFFVSRGELIQWINKTFKLNLSKIEQLGTGAVYCQILDAIHPGKVPINKVNWKSKHEWEFVQNFKILQQCFLKFKMKKHIEVERLIRAKYQDNLEFAQWMKRYYDLNKAAENGYDPVERRGEAEPDFSFAEKPTPKRRSEKSIPAMSKSKNRQLESLSPSARRAGRTIEASLLERNHNSLDNEEASDALTKIYTNLIEVKRTIKARQQGSPDVKLKKIFDIVDSTLKLKLFKKEKKKARLPAPENNSPEEKVTVSKETGRQ